MNKVMKHKEKTEDPSQTGVDKGDMTTKYNVGSGPGKKKSL